MERMVFSGTHTKSTELSVEKKEAIHPHEWKSARRKSSTKEQKIKWKATEDKRPVMPHLIENIYVTLPINYSPTS